MNRRLILLVLTLTVVSLLVGVGTVSADGPDYDEAEGPDRTEAPRLMEVSEDGSRVFVALAGSDEILIINTTNDEVVKRVPSYGDDPRDLKVVGENRLLVPNWGSGNVALVNTSTGGTIKNFTASVGEQPWAIETTTTEDKGDVAVVASWNGTEDDRGTVTFINITDFVVDDIVEIPSTNDGGPWGVATCPPPNPIYFTNDGDDITVRMTFDPFRLDIVGMGELPWDAGCIPNPRGSGSILAVANGGSDDPPGSEKVDVIGGKVPIGWVFDAFKELSPEEQKQAESLFAATGGAFSTTEDDPKYVRNRTGNATVEIIKVDDQGIVKDRIVVPIASDAPPADKEPWGISFSEDGNVFMTDMHLNLVMEINSSTGEIEGNFSTGEAPRDAVSANGKLYVANSGTHEISSKEDGFDYTENVTTSGSIGVHDLETRNRIKTLSLGDGDASPSNPFFDASGNPLSRRTVINRIIEWNTNGTIDGTPFTRREIIDFLVEWNTATS